MAQQLTTGALQSILNGHNIDKPVLQVLNMKKIQSENSSSGDRYRLQMSDGDHYQPCMLATQMNELIQSGELSKFCTVRVNKYICNTVHERKIIILVNLSVVQNATAIGRPIGSPQALDLVRVPTGDQPSKQNGNSGAGGRPGAGSGGGGAHSGMQSRPNPPIQQQRFGGGGPGGGGASMAAGGGASGAYSRPAPTGPGFSPSQRTVFPISSLSPYQSRWTIRVRVATTPNIRHWSNSRGEGRVLNVDLVDESGEIRASAFNELADRFHSMLVMGKMYFISRGRLKPANKQYTTIKNDYELSFTDDTEVEECFEDVKGIPVINCNFVPIADIESKEPNSLIDVIGICKTTADIAEITTKSNRKLSKRDIHLVDRSGRVVQCTLWGDEAEKFDGSQSPVIAIKGCKVSDFGGKSLSTQFSSVTLINPDIPEAHQLRGWYDNVGKDEAVASISNQGMGGGGGGGPAVYLSLSQVKELDLGTKEKADFFSCNATVTFVKKDNCLYKACPSADCNKKVTEGGSGEYFCEKCNRGYPNFKYRIILSINVADHSSSQWLTCFQESAVEVLGKSSEELGNLKDQDEAMFDQVFQQANFKEFNFKVRAKMDFFNDEHRLKCYCAGISPVNYAEETRRRVAEIKLMMGH